MNERNEITPRERVRLAMNLQEPDRVPIEFGGGVSNFHEDVYREFEEHLGIGYWKIWTTNWGGFKVDERVLQRLHVDFRHIWFGFGGTKCWTPVKVYPDGTYTDFWNIRYRAINHIYSNIVEYPLQGAKDPKDIENYFAVLPDPRAVGAEAAEDLKEEAEYLSKETSYAIKGEPMWSHFELAQWIRGMQEFFIDMVERQEMAFTLQKELYEYQALMYQKFFEAVGDYLDVLWTSDDFGGQQGSLISRQDFVEQVKPWQKKRVDYIRERAPNAKIFHHTCGSAYEVIPELIDIGYDGLNPLQPFAKNMEPERLKEEFGDKLFFLGGLDHQFILSKSTQEVKEFTERLIKAYAPGGGYILGPTHVVPRNTRVEGIIAACDHVLEIGKYT